MQSINLSSMRFFSLDEARAVLPEVKVLVEKLQRTKHSLEVFKNIEIEFCDESVLDDINMTKINKEFHRLSYQFFDCIDKLEEIGCVLKDSNLGLVDFYSIVDGREILFCWRFGENDITHWHDLEAGFRGRMPIASLLSRETKIDK